MFCRYCGKEFDDDQLFCPFCGKSVKRAAVNKTEETSPEPQFVNEQYEKEKKKKNKAPMITIIVLSVLVAAGLGMGAYFMLGNSDGGGEEVDLQKLVSQPTVYGYNGQGEVDEELYLDEEKMDAYLGTIKDTQRRSAIKGVLLTAVYRPDTCTELSNGDIITFAAEYDKGMAADVGLTVVSEPFELTVDGLEEESNEEETVAETKPAEGSEAQFIKRIAGLWLNGCEDAASAKESAKAIGITDVSMTEFTESGGVCYMSTYGDVTGEYDGDTVPALSHAAINFSYISPDYSMAKGVVAGEEITFDMGASNDQVIYYSCGGYYTHCAYNGFSSLDAMDRYLYGQ